MQEIKKCPFCGSEYTIIVNRENYVYAYCLDCFAQGPNIEFNIYNLRGKEREAIRKWNERAD